MPRDDLLVWMDLEMTALDARVNQIIEIAVVLTDRDLNVVAEGPDLIIHADASAFDHIPASARALHEKNGLVELAPASALSLADAEAEVLAFLEERVAPQSAPLCGNSIWVDRHFLRLQMPRVDAHLFYRCIDVSTIKELARRWAPAVYGEAARRKGESAHRAKDDVMASISELAFYRGAFFTR
ncbi:MAG TPA: oligoribonuclease [Candidatus Paceibacterota bacterium]|nr:oligoribonuclease [Candidatus Paceibacterota bacterium]